MILFSAGAIVGAIVMLCWLIWIVADDGGGKPMPPKEVKRGEK